MLLVSKDVAITPSSWTRLSGTQLRINPHAGRSFVVDVLQEVGHVLGIHGAGLLEILIGNEHFWRRK